SIHRLFPAEGEELSREMARAFARSYDLIDVRNSRRHVHERLAKELAVAEDRGQQVVEVVRDAAGEPADRLHLLRLQKLLFEQLSLGDVARHAHDGMRRRARLL